jgi:hypothetical protein
MQFLDDFAAAARQAELSEQAYRREVATRIAVLEQERAFAFRRVNLMTSIAESIAGAESEETAVANALATLRGRLGWDSDSEACTAVLAQFAAVAEAIFARLAPEAADEPSERRPVADVGAALIAFESWYAETHQGPFWQLFEHYIPETPRVDF